MKIRKLSYDKVAKAIFSDMPEIIVLIFNDVFNLGIDIDKSSIYLFNSEHPVLKNNEKKKISDFIIGVNDNIFLNLEINRESTSLVKIRNYIYAHNLLIRTKLEGMNYDEINNQYVYQINFNISSGKKNAINKYEMMDIITHEVYIENVKICNIDVDNCRKIMYNEINKDNIKIYRWASIFEATTLEEVDMIIGGDLMNGKMKEKFMKKLSFLNDGSLWDERLELSDEEFLDSVKKKYEDIGIKQGLEQGLEQGMKKGLIQGQAIMIENMLKKNLDLDVIVEYSGFTKEKILKIKNNMAV